MRVSATEGRASRAAGTIRLASREASDAHALREAAIDGRFDEIG